MGAISRQAISVGSTRRMDGCERMAAGDGAMTKIHRVAGLNQLGPARAKRLPVFQVWERYPGNPWTAKNRGRLSAQNRKIKVTLPKLKFMEDA